MNCSCLSSWKTSRFVFWTISSRGCSFVSSSWFNLFLWSTIFFCIPFSLFSRFCVILVNLSSFLFWMSIVSFNCLIPCQSWLNFFSSFELDILHGFFISNINRSVFSSKLHIVWYSNKLGHYTHYYNTIQHYALSYSNGIRQRPYLFQIGNEWWENFLLRAYRNSRRKMILQPQDNRS